MTQRSRERGAAVFIVVMVITLLTAVGVFAARAASIVDAAAGYERQAVQAQYLSELGGKVAAIEFSDPTKAAKYNQKLHEVPVATSGDDAAKDKERCPSNDKIDTSLVGVAAPCLKFTTADLNALVSSSGAERPLLEAQQQDKEGSLGPAWDVASTATEGSLMVEVLDSFQTLESPPGMDKGNTVRSPMAVQLTLTSWAQARGVESTQQNLNNPWCGDSAQSTSASVQRVRAYVTAPLVTR